MLRVVVFLVLSAAAHLLGARWLLAVSPRARRAKRRVLVGALVLSTVPAVLRVVAYAVESPTLRLVMAFAMVELATVVFGLVFAGVFMLAARVGARAVRPADEPAREALVSRREAIERVTGAIAFAGTGAVLGWGVVRGRHAFEVQEVVVRVKGWPRVLDGYTIAQVSDVHVGAFVADRELDEGFELVRRIRPDLVVATGDLVDFEAEQIRHLGKRMVAVPARDGAFAILGNHDHYGGPREVVALAQSGGLPVLCNESRILRAGDGGGFALVGVDDLQGRRRGVDGFRGPDLARAVAGIDPDKPRILLAHQPSYFRESAGRVALQLSGHTHGGQINPGFRPASLLMEFVEGRYVREGSTLWVNRGFGVAGPPSRVGAPPEITKIVLVSA